MKTLTLAIRSLLRIRLYSGINILGLTLSLSCFILLSCYIYQETTTDHFCKDLDRVGLLTVQRSSNPVMLGSTEYYQWEGNNTDPLQDPAVSMHSLFKLSEMDYIRYNEYDYRVNILIADDRFLELLPFPVIAGSAHLANPNHALITEELAYKLFGKEDPLGKTFQYTTGKMVTVTGVIGRTPTKSSFTFDLILPHTLQEWNIISMAVVKLASESDFGRLNKKYEHFMEFDDYTRQPTRFQFLPLKKFYFDTSVYTRYQSSIRKGNLSNIWALSFICLLVFSIGLFNFINLYTVIIMRRSREFGVKKVYGADPGKVFRQIFTENILLTGMALLLSWFVIEILYWILQLFFDIQLQTDSGFNFWLTGILLIATSLIATLYPFFKFSYSNPITTIRGINNHGYSITSRMVVLCFQYILTFSIILSALFFTKQLHYMLNLDLGYHTKDIIKAEMLHEKRNNEYIEGYREEFRNRAVYIWDKIQESPLFFYHIGQEVTPNDLLPIFSFRKEGGPFIEMGIDWVSNEYFEMFGIELKEGRLWDDKKDEWAQYKVIVNETAIKLLDIQDIDNELLYPTSRLWFSSDIEGMDTNPPYEIVGVVKDFKVGHLSGHTPPIAFFYEENRGYPYVMASIVPGKKQEAIRFLKELHTEYSDGGEFSYSFVEDEIAAMYETDKRTARIYGLFSVIAIFISCLGLFGISMFDIRQRYREIAIRKVNGAITPEIVRLLLKKYVKLFLLSFIIAVPVSYAGIRYYMQDFAHVTSLSWWLYAIALLFTGAISLLTLLYHIRKAARMNPAKVTKSE